MQGPLILCGNHAETVEKYFWAISTEGSRCLIGWYENELEANLELEEPSQGRHSDCSGTDAGGWAGVAHAPDFTAHIS